MDSLFFSLFDPQPAVKNGLGLLYKKCQLNFAGASVSTSNGASESIDESLSVEKTIQDMDDHELEELGVSLLQMDISSSLDSLKQFHVASLKKSRGAYDTMIYMIIELVAKYKTIEFVRGKLQEDSTSARDLVDNHVPQWNEDAFDVLVECLTKLVEIASFTKLSNSALIKSSNTVRYMEDNVLSVVSYLKKMIDNLSQEKSFGMKKAFVCLQVLVTIAQSSETVKQSIAESWTDIDAYVEKLVHGAIDLSALSDNRVAPSFVSSFVDILPIMKSTESRVRILDYVGEKGKIQWENARFLIVSTLQHIHSLPFNILEGLEKPIFSLVSLIPSIFKLKRDDERQHGIDALIGVRSLLKVLTIDQFNLLSAQILQMGVDLFSPGFVVGDAKRDALLGYSRVAHVTPSLDVRAKLYAQWFDIIKSSTESDSITAHAASTLSSWWIASNTLLDDGSLAFLKDFLASFSKFSVRVKREILYGLGEIAEANEAFISTNMKFFFDFVAASEAKIAERTIAVHALRLLMRSSISSKKISGQLPGNQIFKKVVGGPSPFLVESQTLLTRYAKSEDMEGCDDFDSLADILMITLKNYSSHLKLKDSKQLFVAFSSIIAGTFSAKAADRVSKTYKSEFASNSQISNVVFEGFVDYLHSLNESELTTEVRENLANAFLVLVPECNVETNAVSLGKIIQIAHHPFYITSTETFKNFGDLNIFWRVYDALLQQNESLDSLIHQKCDDILSYLVSSHGIGAPIREEAIASGYAISSLLSENDSLKVFTLISESLTKNYQLHTAYSKEDFEIYHTSPDNVHRDLEDEIDSNPIFYNIPDHKRNKYSLPKAEWEKLIKDEQEIKKKNPSMDLTQIKRDLLKKIYLVREAKLRSQIHDLVTKTMSLLDVAIAIASNPHKAAYLERDMSLITLYISDFMSSPAGALAKKAFEAFLACGVATFGEKAELARLLAYGTYKLTREDVDIDPVSELGLQIPSTALENNVSLAEYIVAQLRKANTVGVEQFSIPLPFLSIVLTSSKYALNKVSLSQAMSTLGTFSGLPGVRSGVARKRIVSIAVSVLNTHTNLSKAAKSTLLSGAPFMLPNDIGPLLDGLLSLNDSVRTSCLETLSHFAPLMVNAFGYEERKELFNPPNPLMQARLFLAMHDISEQCRNLATNCWNNFWTLSEEKANDSTFLGIFHQTLPLLNNKEDFVRENGGAAIGASLALITDKASKTLLIKELISQYDSFLSVEDENGRLGVAAAIGACGKGSLFQHLELIFDFILNTGFKDTSSEVCNAFSKAGESIIRDTSEENKNQLSNVFEKHLKKVQASRVRNQKEQEHVDFVTGNLAVYLGTVARYADYTQAQVKEIVERLVQTLSVHSMVVQNAVSNALTYLVIKMNSDDLDQIVVQLCEGAAKGDYGDRRGAAFGIAGVMKGLGVAGIRECNLMARVDSLLKRGTPEALEGVMQIYELLSLKLEKLFDPYVPEILPSILTCISDSRRDVHEAADHCVSQLMKNITPHSTRMILPTILENMKIEVAQKVDYKKRQATVTLLGAMAYSAPKMLSSYLPIIVNILKDALVEVHEGVSSAAKKALERVGGQAENPEIKHQIPDLLKALSEPTEKSNEVLDSLLFTRFTHSIDPCSLALLMPVLQRALAHRDQNLKKKAGQIIGSVSSLVNDPAVVMPYLSTILPLLHELLIDHQPRVRKSAAKSIGTLAKTLGESRLQDMIDWVHATLQNPSSALVERHGCSQAVAEICSSQTPTKLKSTIALLVDYSRSPHANVRMGYIQIFQFLPEILQQDFCTVLGDCMPRVLQGISDDDDDVSTVSFSASQLMIRMFADSAISMVLPALEQGMQEEQWRTRHASVVLLGDFLQRISDTNKPANIHLRGDQTIHMDTIFSRIEEKHVHLLLSLLYILHSDVTATVRSEAHRVWRSIISHSPRALRSIMSTLIDLIVDHLSHSNEEKRQCGARCIGELVGRMGDTVASDLIPLLSDKLHSPNPQTRQGVCIGLTELMNAAPNRVIIPFVAKLLPAIQRAVSDSDATVQDAASLAFHALMSICGGDAVSQVVNAMLKDLNDPSSEKQAVAVVGLQKLVRTSGDMILRHLIPAVVVEGSPITTSGAQTLSAVFSVAGHHLLPYLHIFEKLVIQAGQVETEASDISVCYNENPFHNALYAFLHTCHDLPKALDVIIEKTLLLLQSNFIHNRLGAVRSIQLLFTNLNPKSEFATNREVYLPTLIPHIIRLFIDPVIEIVQASWHAFNLLLKSIPSDEQDDFIINIATAIFDVTIDERGISSTDTVAAFNLPNGLTPFITLFMEGVMNGSSTEVREHSADAIAACIRLTKQENFEAYVLKLGPLIRIASNKFQSQLIVAVLKCIVLLLEKGGKKAKPFVPSMQTIFVKSLTSTSSAVRSVSADGLALVVNHGARIKTLVTELMTTLKGVAIDKVSYDVHSHGICVSLCNALEKIMASKGREIKDKQIQEITEHFISIIEQCKNTKVMKAAANAFGACIGQSDLSQKSITYPNPLSEGYAVGGMAKHCPEKIEIEPTLDALYSILDDEKIDERRIVAVECAIEILLHAKIEDWNPFLQICVKELTNGTLTNKITTVKCIKRLAKQCSNPENLYPLAESIARLSKERNSLLKDNLQWATFHIFGLYGQNLKNVQAFFASNKTLSGDDVETLRDYVKRVAVKLGNEEEVSSDDEETED